MLKEGLKRMAAWMMMALLVISAIRYMPATVSVSTSVDGRELPIYCVETEKPQVALSFDAACGGGQLGEKLYTILIL